MFCPKCGTESATGLNFCRRCGLSLQRVSTALSTEFSADELKPTGADEARRRALRRAFRLLPLGVVLFVVGIIFAVLGSDLLKVQAVETAGVVMILLGMLAGGIGFLNPELYQKAMGVGRPRELPEKPKPALPDAPFAVEMPSVTEATTRNLAPREHER
jgi:hypothetical protein